MSTDTLSQAPTAGEARDERRRAVRRALAVDLRLNAAQFGGTMALAALALVLAILWTDLLSSFAVLWAALAWYRYGRADSLERDALRASLGISRADRVRGRVALVAIESAALVLVNVLGTVAAELDGRGDPTTVVVGGTGSALLEALYLVIGAALALAIVAMGVGRECTTRRPGWGMFAITIAVMIGATFVAAIVTMLAGTGIALGGGTTSHALAVSGLLAGAVITGIVLTILRSRIGLWIRSLDSGPGAAQR